MKTLLRLLLKSQHQRNRSGSAQTEKGMTLVELLVGSIMAFLIITPMLAFVVDMLNTDRREQVKASTEQDIQAAVDFIAQDLSQAIYIYDNNPDLNGTPNTTPTGIPAIQNFLPPTNANQTPILVFWKRELIENSMPLTAGDQPDDCQPQPPQTGPKTCNDTYVLALVAYYQVKGSPDKWCQPSGTPGTPCPSRIVRYQIKDGLRDPSSTDVNPLDNYFTEVSDAQERSKAFNPIFDISKPTENVTISTDFGGPEVLVNYIDHSSPGPTVPVDVCMTALGNPTIQNGGATQAIPEERLKIVGATNSFYACVDTQRNIARVTIRGNSLRRIQTDKADYEAKKAAYFPTASVQVQGLGARGK